MNMVDLGVIVVIGLSGILALVRGLVSEVLSVTAWVGAALGTLYAYDRLTPYMRDHVHPDLLADAMTVVGVFVLSLVVLSVIAHELSRHVQDSSLSAVNRSLGLLFGLARGMLLVTLAWMVVSWMIPEAKDRPLWLNEARSLPMVEAGAAYLQAMVPSQIRDQASAQTSAALEQARQAMDAEALRRLTTPKPEAPQPAANTPAPDTGYQKKDRGDLDRLIKNAN